uniref:Uncharacterized protein n=1 Tax=Anguilla anguilla TaxID=7936 RepID=A0A0E9QA05_ANGAN
MKFVLKWPILTSKKVAGYGFIIVL